MKKKFAGIATIFIVCTIIIDFNNKEKIDKEVSLVRKENNLLSLYVENDNGGYDLSKVNTWPTDGYGFNSELSKCENGGTLSWDNENNTVIMSGNVLDKCYIYFDKVILPTITAIVTEVTDSTITINSTSNKGTFDVNKYYYSIDNGATFTESNSNTYTFISLDDSTTYNIVVYVDDTKGNKSVIFKLSGTTKSSKPVINSVTIDSYNTDEAKIFFNITYTSKDTITEVYASENGTSYKKCTYGYGKYSYETSIRYCSGKTINDIKIYIKNSEGITSDIYTISTYTVTCFPAGTKIYTKNSYKNIEDIRVNDVVYSYNEITEKVELNKVTKTFIHEDIEIYNLYLNNEIIKVTPYHRFYILRNNNYEWVAAKDLKLTDKLFDINKKYIKINKTYFVSENNILVHNAKIC